MYTRINTYTYVASITIAILVRILQMNANDNQCEWCHNWSIQQFWVEARSSVFIYSENLPSGLSNEVIPAQDVDDLQQNVDFFRFVASTVVQVSG